MTIITAFAVGVIVGLAIYHFLGAKIEAVVADLKK